MRARPLKYDMVSVAKELCKNFVDWIPADPDHLSGFRPEHPAFAASSGPLYLMAALGTEDRHASHIPSFAHRGFLPSFA